MITYNKALFLYNGNAGKKDIERKLSLTVPVLSQAIKELTILQTETLEEARRVCVEYAEEIELLIILGGDGTIHTCINSIAPLDKRPIIAILPGGTSNDFCRTLGIPQNLKAAANAIVNGSVIDIDIGKSNDNYFLNFWGIGLVAETSQNIDETQKKNLGVLSYFLSTVKTFSQAESFSYTITTNEGEFNGEAVLILVLNGNYIGTQEIPVGTLSPMDGKMNVLIIENSNFASFRELLAMNNPRMDAEDFQELSHFAVNELKIKTNKPKKIDMDGELYTSTPADITTLAGHIRIIGNL
ncbi:YegS/Rv2252/BmrU family lipid kinase [Virgibacillus halodenitrificans]|uniref:YegS/Rv2252/BmrU family lipid kinase n=1 Tax=Virgibacillus halodenitrificans TaxID=1482 RepID=A0ABR7VMK6_VIRHA|nr:YegS/Rv2252/BmrU family lipid kinase [Virgibacillus halodenitrificans]MBD1223141.1 YegS/Rv2252/BmrU family lipid kinase [Virgibacillus halodenitrificans]